jgi:hypothetical protein
MNQKQPYLKKRKSYTVYLYNPDFGDEEICAALDCGHPYRRHFDSYSDWAAVGCKYCGCGCFKPQKLKCE